MRPLQIWVSDTRRAGFAEECRRQSLLLQDDSHERDTTDWLDAAADQEGWR
ncbi:MAG: antitoxin MazE family protein [Thiobacillus sp.]